MITQLNIRNFGLIDELSLEFTGALNILTGETGAGKSIIIDALRFCLGEPLNASQIRDRSVPSVVEIVCDLSSEELRQSPAFSEFMGGETTLIIYRSQDADGRKKIKVNGISVTVSRLREVGNHLVDFHGAHDHQLIFSEDSHLSVVDRLTDFGASKDEYREVFKKFKEVNDKINEFAEARNSRDRDIDFLAHQIKELEQVPLDSRACEQTRQKQVQLDNAEKLYGYLNELLHLLENDETGAGRMLSQSFGPLRRLNGIDASSGEFTESLIRIQEEVNDLVSRLAAYRDNLSFEPEEAKQINKNCDIYDEIMRKYGPELEDAKKVYLEAKSRYDVLFNLDQNDGILRRELSGIEKELENIAAQMTRLRKKTARLLKETIEKELSELGIPHARFECRMEKAPLNTEGADRVVFYLSPNAGEELKPLAEIISSGEAARLMLALKKALTRVDTVPVLIFDEIDAQIGGRLGTVTGRKLKELSSNRQVILITHLPQIASFADRHFRVSKKVENNRTITVVELLDQDARVKEMAKMMSGDKESSISLEHAHDMMSAARRK
ncbi:MAG: DNA repair protein RecN [Candidatus Omnitrophica bacterium]|nr:DNA repair protein RecN [Candidatus Omnitrophota bacterium]